MTMERRILPPPPKTDRTASLTFSPVGQRVTSAIRPIGLLKTGAIEIPGGGEFVIPAKRKMAAHPFTPEEIEEEARLAKLPIEELKNLIKDTLNFLAHIKKRWRSWRRWSVCFNIRHWKQSAKQKLVQIFIFLENLKVTRIPI